MRPEPRDQVPAEDSPTDRKRLEQPIFKAAGQKMFAKQDHSSMLLTRILQAHRLRPLIFRGDIMQSIRNSAYFTSCFHPQNTQRLKVISL
ncbi:MAG TPA: hypothetical protein DDY20_06210 [Desulfobulbaceae bacterium]|nr:hypothetical protein [Desulfobulbaceae bacterium]